MVQVDVSGNGNCILHSLSLSYLLSVVDSDAQFVERFKTLFGDDFFGELLKVNKNIRVLRKESDEYFSDVTIEDDWNKLMCVFRQRLVDYIAGDTLGSDGANQYEPFFPKDDDQLRREQFEGCKTFKEYLHKIRAGNTWMNEFVIKAASHFLNHPITLITDTGYTRSYNGHIEDLPIKLIYVNKNHYKFVLRAELLSESCKISHNDSLDSSSTSDRSSDDDTDTKVTSFLFAVRKRNYKKIRSILNKTEESNKCLTNFKDMNSNGNTPLHMSLKNIIKNTGNKNKSKIICDIIQLLVENGADPYAKNNDDQTAMDIIDNQLSEHPDDFAIKYLQKLFHNKCETSNRIIKADCSNVTDSPVLLPETTTRQVPPNTQSQNVKKRLPTDLTVELDLACNNQKRFKKNIPTYSASGLKTSLHGTIYQLQLLMLFAHRSVNEFAYFDLATEMDQAEKFDDVVLRNKHSPDDQWRLQFLQAKHKMRPEINKINIKDLITESDGDFSLQKYFISFCKIKSNPTFQDSILESFVLCTNTGLNFEVNPNKRNNGSPTVVAKHHNELLNKWKTYLKIESLKNNPLFYFNRSTFKGVKVKFSDSAYKDVFLLLKSVIIKKCLNFNRTKDFKYINRNLAAQQVMSYKENIEELNQSFQELENKKPATLLEYKNVAKQILNLEGKILEANNCTELKNGIKETKTKKESKDISRRKKKLHIIIKNLHRTINFELQQAEETLNFFDNRNSLESKNLVSDLERLQNFKKQLLYFRKSFSLSSCIEKFNDVLQKCSEIPKNKLTKVSKQATTDLIGAKETVLQHLEKSMANIVMLEVMAKGKFFEYTTEFLKKFQFIFDYPGVDELNLLIGLELGEKFRFLDAQLITDSFEKEMLDWLKQHNKGRSEFLSKDKGISFFNSIREKIEAVMTSGLNKAYPEKLQGYNMVFNRSIDEIKKHLVSTIINVLHISTRSTRLTAIKVLQSLKDLNQYCAQDSFIFVRLKSFLRPETQELVLNSFSSEHNYHLLIIDCQSNDSNSQHQRPICVAILSNIVSINKKVVLIADPYSAFATELKSLDLAKIGCINDTTSFNDLASNSQVALLERDILFQANPVLLGELIDIKAANELLNETMLQNLIEGKSIEIGGTTLSSGDAVPDYYINRHLYPQTVKSEVFKEKDGHILLTSKTERDFDISNYLGSLHPNVFVSNVSDDSDKMLNSD